jgi:hypothetical protein
MLTRMWRKGNIPPLLVGLQPGTNTLEINLGVPQKIGHSTTGRSCNTSPGIYPEEVHSQFLKAAITMESSLDIKNEF